MAAMSPRSCSDRGDSWALGGNRMSEVTKDEDAFVCVIVGLACESPVKSECGQEKRKCEGLLIRFQGKVVE